MHETFQPCVYLVANRKNGTLYVGVTSNLMARIYQHRTGAVAGFTQEYGVARLVWFEQHGTMDTAIQREKQIKKWLRSWKIALIEKDNLDWRDLAVDFGFEPLPSLRIR